MTQTCSITSNAAGAAELRHCHRRYPQMAALRMPSLHPIRRNHCPVGPLGRWKPLNPEVAHSWVRERGIKNHEVAAFPARGGK